MGKGSLFFAKARGKIGEIVLSNVNGQEVQRAYNGSPANPRTANQMYQRGLFADVVKFFTRGQQSFFKFAFEGKKKTESDYNAFVRTNMKYGAYLTKYVMDDPTCPKVGNFILTQGSIPAMPYDYTRTANLVGLWVACNNVPSSITTVGQLSAVLKTWNSALTEGDIVTLVTISSNYSYDFNADMSRCYMKALSGSAAEPRWNIRQFIVNESDTTELSEIGIYVRITGNSVSIFDTYEVPNLAYTSICGAALCVSRNAPGGLKVMTSQLATSAGADAIMYHFGMQDGRLTQAYRNVYLASWGASQEVILQGALARKVEPAVVLDIDSASENVYTDPMILPDDNFTGIPASLGEFSIGSGGWLSMKGVGCFNLTLDNFSAGASAVSLEDFIAFSDTQCALQFVTESASDDPVDILFDQKVIANLTVES